MFRNGFEYDYGFNVLSCYHSHQEYGPEEEKINCHQNETERIQLLAFGEVVLVKDVIDGREEQVNGKTPRIS